jgi:hypothetical protein
MDVDAFHKKTFKDIQKHNLQMALRREVSEMFNRDWRHLTLLEELIDNSVLATEKGPAQEETHLISNKVKQQVAEIRTKYADMFRLLEGTILQFNHFILNGTTML